MFSGAAVAAAAADDDYDTMMTLTGARNTDEYY